MYAWQPIVVATLLMTPALVWVSLDRSIWPWDPAWYGEVSIDLWATLRLNHNAWPFFMEHAFGAKPPGVAWLGQFFVPLADVLGSMQVALLLSIVICQAVSLALVYAAARRLSDGHAVAALVAALAMAGAPLFVSMSREYFAEPLQTVAVTWALFIMVAAARWRPALTIAQLTAAVSLGLLAKVSTPLYMLAPAGVALAFAIVARRRRLSRVWWRDPQVVTSIGLAATLMFGTVAWYRTNLEAAIDHARLAAETELYGTRDQFFSESAAWLGRFEDAAFLPNFSLLLMPIILWTLVVAVGRRRALSSADFTGHVFLCHVACLATVAAVLTTFALQPNEEVRFLLPLVPCFALLLGGAVSAAGSRRLAALAALILGCQFTLVTLQSFGSLGAGEFSYFRVRSPEQPALAGELREVIRLTCTGQAHGRISVVGVDYPSLNGNTLSMLADEQFALRGRQCQYTALGWAEGDAEAAWTRVRELDPPYYVSIDYGNPAKPVPAPLADQIHASDPFNAINKAVFGRVVRSGAFETVGASRQSGLVVFRAKTD